jgi:hypothetical protein
MIWARMLAYITGTVDQELPLRNEYLAAENRILRAQIKGRLLLSDAEKATLAELAHRLGRKALEELAAVAKPETLLAWYRKLIANKFDGSKFRKSSGRPRLDTDLGVDKNFAMRDKQNIQFRLTGFNFINHPLPQFGIGADDDLELTGGATGTNTNTSTTGTPQFKVGRRVLELAIKYVF